MSGIVSHMPGLSRTPQGGYHTPGAANAGWHENRCEAKTDVLELVHWRGHKEDQDLLVNIEVICEAFEGGIFTDSLDRYRFHAGYRSNRHGLHDKGTGAARRGLSRATGHTASWMCTNG